MTGVELRSRKDAGVTRDHLRRRLSLISAAKSVLDQVGDGKAVRQMEFGVKCRDVMRLPEGHESEDLVISVFDMRVALAVLEEDLRAELARAEAGDAP